MESSPRRRGRTPNGPLPTGVMLATVVSASPVDSVLSCSIEARVTVSTCSGIWRVSRSDARRGDADFGVEHAEIELHGDVDGRVGALDHDRARGFGEARPGDDDQIRAGRRRLDLKPAVRAGVRLGLLAGGHAAQDDVTARQRGASDIGHDATNGGGEGRSGRQNGRQEYTETLNR